MNWKTAKKMKRGTVGANAIHAGTKEESNAEENIRKREKNIQKPMKKNLLPLLW